MKINLGKLEEVHASEKNCAEVSGMWSEVESWGGKGGVACWSVLVQTEQSITLQGKV